MRELEFIKIYYTKFLTCLPVAPIDMEATVGGSGGIPLDSSLETGKGKEKNLEKWRLKYLWIQGMGTRQEKEQEEEIIVRMFSQKIRSYEEGKCRGKNTQLDNLPELRKKWDRIYEWIIVLMVFIDKMKYEQLKNMRTKRMKFVLYVAAGLGIREGTENLVNPQKESEEDFVRRILEVLKKAREENLRNKEERVNETKENGLARVHYPARGEDETKTH